MSRLLRKLTRPLRYGLGIRLLRLCMKMTWLLSRSWTLRIGRALGNIAYVCSPGNRRQMLEALAASFPEKDNAWHRRTARLCCQSLATGAIEVLQMPSLAHGRILDLVVNPEALHPVKTYMEKEGPCVFVTGHVSNWEYCGSTSYATGFPFRTLAKRMKNKTLDAFVSELRASQNVEIIYNDENPRLALRTLREGRPVAMLVDQDLPDFDGLFLDFFGRPAYTSVAPASLARAGNAFLVTTFLVREGERFRLVVGEPYKVSRDGDKQDTIREATERWTRELEEVIRRYPEQWVWMHRRWRTTPERLARRKAREGKPRPETT